SKPRPRRRAPSRRPSRPRDAPPVPPPAPSPEVDGSATRSARAAALFEVGARRLAPQRAEDAVKLSRAAEAGGERGVEQVVAAFVDEHVEALQPQTIAVLDQRQSHLRLEDARQTTQRETKGSGQLL